MINHRNAGLVTLAAFLPAAIWRLVAGGRVPDRLTALYWLLIGVGTAAVVVTAYLGGSAVFRYGVGVLLDG